MDFPPIGGRLFEDAPIYWEYAHLILDLCPALSSDGLYKPDCDSHTHSKPNRHAPAIDGGVDRHRRQTTPSSSPRGGCSLALKQEGGRISLSTEGRTLDPFKKIEFSGTTENGSITGNITWDGHASQTHFIQLVSVTEEILAEYEGVYRFDSGRALSIIVSPEFSSSGLEYFGRPLMMTVFENGDLRSLYALDDSTFVVGVQRVVGAPFDGRIQFMKDEQGNIEGLMWWETPNDILASPVPSE